VTLRLFTIGHILFDQLQALVTHTSKMQLKGHLRLKALLSLLKSIYNKFIGKIIRNTGMLFSALPSKYTVPVPVLHLPVPIHLHITQHPAINIENRDVNGTFFQNVLNRFGHFV
jgi:hypothetical protein